MDSGDSQRAECAEQVVPVHSAMLWGQLGAMTHAVGTLEGWHPKSEYPLLHLALGQVTPAAYKPSTVLVQRVLLCQ